MGAIEELAVRGFTNAEVVNTTKRQIVVRIRTARGWTYEKFPADQPEPAIAAWAAKHKPE